MKNKLFLSLLKLCYLSAEMSEFIGKNKPATRKMPESVLTVFLSAFLVFSLSCHASERSGGKYPEKKYYRVIRVNDGDTFRVDNGSEKGMAVRLIGIDAPETRRTRLKEVGYYAEESRAYLSKLILDKSVRLEFDVDTFDRYQRTLAYVYLGDGTFINAHMLMEGYATVLTVPPNVKYAEEFVKLARKARERKRGLWKGTMLSGNEI